MYVRTLPLNYNFIFTHMVTQSISHINAQVFHGNMYFHETKYGIATRSDVVFTQDVAFPCNGIMALPYDLVMLTKPNN